MTTEVNFFERNRDFKGVWIPKDIWLNDKLTMLEKVILIEIDSLDNEEHCVAGNEYLAQFCQCSIPKVTQAIKKLSDLGYIEIISFDGRHRRIRSCIIKSMKQTNKKYEAASGKVLAINIDNNIDNNIAIINNGETSSPNELNKSSANEFLSTKETLTKKPPDPSEGQKPKRISRKDQLVNYVNELEYADETKKVLFDWIFQIGLGRGVTVNQLHDMLKEIWDLYNNEELVRQSIKESYLKNWFGFFPVKNNPQNSPENRRKTEPSTVVNNTLDNKYIENEKPVSKRYTKGCWGEYNIEGN